MEQVTMSAEERQEFEAFKAAKAKKEAEQKPRSSVSSTVRWWMRR